MGKYRSPVQGIVWTDSDDFTFFWFQMSYFRQWKVANFDLAFPFGVRCIQCIVQGGEPLKFALGHFVFCYSHEVDVADGRVEVPKD